MPKSQGQLTFARLYSVRTSVNVLQLHKQWTLCVWGGFAQLNLKFGCGLSIQSFPF
jgi:hypothetical protein